LTGIFGLPGVSGVGISFGADRIYDVLNTLGLYPDSAAASTKVMFANFGDKEAEASLSLIKELRQAGISAELYPDQAKLKKQFAYADALAIPFVAIIGENELNQKQLTLKNMNSGEQTPVAFGDIVSKLNELL
ncbi:MAG: histidine--tRNA ligase, partial [Muribaculaceae bacterium]|nr:histidine--tRNA ligase [Muribaculaceae bacterium]